MESPFPLSISPASKFLSYFETLLSSILYFYLSFENYPPPPPRLYSLIPPGFLVTINSSPFCLPFPSILNLRCFTSPIPPAFQLQLITFTFSFVLLPSFLKPTPPSIVYCTRFLMWRHYQPWDDDALPNRTKLINYSWINTPSESSSSLLTHKRIIIYIDFSQFSLNYIFTAFLLLFPLYREHFFFTLSSSLYVIDILCCSSTHYLVYPQPPPSLPSLSTLRSLLTSPHSFMSHIPSHLLPVSRSPWLYWSSPSLRAHG